MSVNTDEAVWTFAAPAGDTLEYPIGMVLDGDDVMAALYDGDGEEMSLATYSVTDTGDENGATVVFDEEPDAAGDADAVLMIWRVTPRTQSSEIDSFGASTGLVQERRHDRIMLIAQELSAGIERSVRAPLYEEALPPIPPAAARANLFAAYNSDGDPIATPGTNTDGVPISAAMTPVVGAVSLAAARTAMGVPATTDTALLAGDNAFTGDNTFDQPVTVPAPVTEDHAIPAGDVWYHVPAGYIVACPTDDIPDAFLLCDGSAVSRATYASLFSYLVTIPGFTAQTFTVTIASPGVVTKASHGFTGGERLRLSTDGALPTGLDTTSDFYVIYVDANTFQLASSEANAAAGTAINTSGSQSGTHSYTRSLYGLGDGSTTFNVPDLRDVFLRGQPASGRALGSYQASQNLAHTHTIGYSAGNLAGGAGGNSINAGATLATSSSNGGSEARPINRALNWIIKT